MERAALEALGRAALIELILQLQERVVALETEVARLRPPKTPTNSSVPPSQGFKANRAGGRRQKRGPKRGHLGCSRRRVEPDVVVACRPTECGHCGADVAATEQRRVQRRQVVELPELRPVVVEAQVYAADCPQCGERTTGTLPPGFEAGRTFGPRLEALLGYLHYRHHLAHERLREVCASVFGVTLSAGGVAGVLDRLGERLGPEAERLGVAVRASPVIGSDETGVRVDGQTWWHWVFQTPTASYHTVAPSRGGQVIRDFLGDTVPAVWGSDAYGAQLATVADAHQLCLSHQIRDLTYAAEADHADGQRWARQLRHVFGRAIRLHRERAHVTPASFARRRTRIERAADRLICEHFLRPGEAATLQRRYQKHWDALFIFLHRDDVEPTNNASERDLRNVVIHEKVTGGYRSPRGAAHGAVFATLLATARKRGHNLFEQLCVLAGTSPLQALHPAT
ncbi:MAG: IS66 family transposase [Chloroflexi bacterium]|nr:IS66 family transposase [Chloroflexota bacterium]